MVAIYTIINQSSGLIYPIPNWGNHNRHNTANIIMNTYRSISVAATLMLLLPW